MNPSQSSESEPRPPVVDGGWVRPSSVWPAEPRWGLAEGIQVGLSPIPGPRGLVRIFTPYLGQPQSRLLNFLAFEPIPSGATERGYSELEHSSWDLEPGKRFWSAETIDAGPAPSEHPVRGTIDEVDGVERLSLYVHSEPFDNGARVAVRIEFRADRPHEFSIETYRLPGSVPLDAFVVTATMGNFARLRRLQLLDEIVTPSTIWPHFDGEHFAARRRFALDRLRRTPTGGVTVAVSSDEPDPVSAVYHSSVADHWRYVGSPAVQSWEAEDPDPAIAASVNARRVYWASESPIPGGDAFENVELIEPFRQGRRFVFRVEPLETSA